ncbi:hypothetical protein LTZ17_11820 [Lacticaseibacillus casei]|nr:MULTISPECIES: hypothetical protein [Lacticaseibacillus]MDE3283345.1 hypothetical protein [Lacticaseibacillus casei]
MERHGFDVIRPALPIAMFGFEFGILCFNSIPQLGGLLKDLSCVEDQPLLILLGFNRNTVSFCFCAGLITALALRTYLTVVHIEKVGPYLISALVFLPCSSNPCRHKTGGTNEHARVFIEIPRLLWCSGAIEMIG